MNKALDEVKTLRAFNLVELKNDKNVNKSLDIIEKALLRLEAIDNAKPSEALENLERLDIAVRYSTIDDEGYSLKEPRKMTNICDEEFNTIKQALLKLEHLEDMINLPTNCFSTLKDRNDNEVVVIRKELFKKYREQEKVLEILKEKRVDLSYLRCCIEDNQSVERYNEYIRNKTMDYDHEKELTQEEFELLKRCFE